MIERLDRARTADDDDPFAADVDAADADDAVVRLRLAAHQLVRVRDADDFLDAGEILENLRVGRFLLLSGDADGGAVDARNRVCFEPHLLDVANDCFDLFRPSAGIHYYEHWRVPLGM